MKKTLAPLGFIFLLSACAQYTTLQEDIRYNETSGLPSGKITTRVSVTTFANAKSDLAKSTVTQTEKSQSSKVGSINQEATNNIITDLTALIKASK
jgi:hypothetical protein